MTLPPHNPAKRAAASIVQTIFVILLALVMFFIPVYLVQNPELFFKGQMIMDAMWFVAKMMLLAIFGILLLIIGIGAAMWAIEEHHEYGWLTTGRIQFTKESDVGKNRRCTNCRQVAEVDEGVVTGKEIISGIDSVLFGFLISRNEETKRFDCMECYEADPISYSLREENPGYRPEDDAEAEQSGDSE